MAEADSDVASDAGSTTAMFNQRPRELPPGVRQVYVEPSRLHFWTGRPRGFCETWAVLGPCDRIMTVVSFVVCVGAFFTLMWYIISHGNIVHSVWPHAAPTPAAALSPLPILPAGPSARLSAECRAKRDNFASTLAVYLDCLLVSPHRPCTSCISQYWSLHLALVDIEDRAVVDCHHELLLSDDVQAIATTAARLRQLYSTYSCRLCVHQQALVLPAVTALFAEYNTLKQCVKQTQSLTIDTASHSYSNTTVGTPPAAVTAAAAAIATPAATNAVVVAAAGGDGDNGSASFSVATSAAGGGGEAGVCLRCEPTMNRLRRLAFVWRHGPVCADVQYVMRGASHQWQSHHCTVDDQAVMLGVLYGLPALFCAVALLLVVILLCRRRRTIPPLPFPLPQQNDQ